MNHSRFPSWLIGLAALCLLLACTATVTPQLLTATPLPSATRTTEAGSFPTLTPTVTPLTATPTITPTATPLPATPTFTPIADSSVGLNLSGVHMVDEANGWAWATPPDGACFLLHTADGGQTWRDITPAQFNAPAYFLDAQTAWVFIEDPTSFNTSLARSLDGGQSWSVLSPSLSLFNAAMTFLDPQNGWATTYDIGAGQAHIGVHETHDGGLTWSDVFLSQPPNLFPPVFEGTLQLCNICGDSFHYDPQRLVIVYGGIDLAPTGAVHLSLSTDLGRTWQEQSLPLPDDNRFANGLIAPLEPVFFDDQAGFLPFRIFDEDRTYSVLAIYATHDGGITWIPNPAVVENVSPWPSVDFVSPLDVFVACGDDLCVTHDGGRTWQTVVSNLVFNYAEGMAYVQQFDFVNAATGWAITTYNDQTTLWKTTNGGETWTKIEIVIAP